MINAIRISLFFLVTSSFSQVGIKDLFILHSNEPDFCLVRSTDSLDTFEVYRINFNLQTRKKYDLKIDKQGNLVKYISLTGSSDKSFSFEYNNIKNNNNPILVLKKNLINKLTYKEIIENISSENFKNIINDFQNIYIVNSNEGYENYYISKKVVVKELIKL